MSGDIEAKEEVAEQVALDWLRLIDDRDYASSWDKAASYFRGIMGPPEWEAAVSPVREPLGECTARQVLSREYKTAMPGAPDGEYVIITFETSFRNKSRAIETVTPMRDKDDHWRVSGYYIK
jgi:Protein of unknown function (DUF4019)